MKKRPSVHRAKPAPKKATLSDVARDAGVSIYTVSRALNNLSGVNPTAREAVLQSARRLGLRPRPIAQRTHFALIIPDTGRSLAGGYVGNVTFHLLTEVSNRGMGLSLFTDSQFDEVASQIFDGIFLLSWLPSTFDRAALLKDTATVVINRFSQADRFHVVGWDHHAEGAAVAEYLYARGHRRPGMITHPPGYRHSTQSRVAGFTQVFAKNKITVDPRAIEMLESSEQLVSALGRVVEQGVDCLYLPGQERIGIDTLRMLQKIFKLRVPEDISIIAGENPGWSGLFDPPLTTVDAPFELLARHCVDHMIMLREKKHPKPTEVLIATPIIERKSVLDRPVVKARPAAR